MDYRFNIIGLLPSACFSRVVNRDQTFLQNFSKIVSTWGKQTNKGLEMSSSRESEARNYDFLQILS